MAFTSGPKFSDPNKSAKAQKIMAGLTSCCDECRVSSSKTVLHNLGDRKLCGRCLPAGMTPQAVAEEAEKYRQHLETEAKKPKPKEYGAWS